MILHCPLHSVEVRCARASVSVFSAHGTCSISKYVKCFNKAPSSFIYFVICGSFAPNTLFNCRATSCKAVCNSTFSAPIIHSNI